MNVYVASKSCHAAWWRQWRDEASERGTTVVSSWIDCDGEPDDLAAHWSVCIADVAASDLLIAMHYDAEMWKGAYVEIGAALALDIPVYVVGSPPGSWVNHPRVYRIKHPNEAIEHYRFGRTVDLPESPTSKRITQQLRPKLPIVTGTRDRDRAVALRSAVGRLDSQPATTCG